MPTSASGYGITAPQAIEPFQIESVLAKIVGENNPGNAANMLDTYQVQNMVSQDNYNYNLQGQHDFARQQLAATMADNARREMVNAAKVPGATSLLNAASGGAPGLGLDPNIVRLIETGLGRAQEAGTLKDATTGLVNASQAGYPMSSEQAAQATGGMVGPRSTPEDIQVAQINAAARIAAAHAGAGGDPYGISIPMAPQPTLSGAAPTISLKKGGTVPGAINWARSQGLNIGQEASPLPPGATGKTNLPAKGETSAPPQRTVSNTAPGGADVHAKAEAYVENEVRTKNRAMYDDIQAGKTGGKVTIVMGADGQPHIKGRERTY